MTRADVLEFAEGELAKAIDAQKTGDVAYWSVMVASLKAAGQDPRLRAVEEAIEKWEP